MAIPKDFYNEYSELDDTILLGWRGSIAHGMYVPNSDPNSIDDKDVMGICVPDIYHYFGLSSFGRKGTKEIYRELHGIMWDIVFYRVSYNGCGHRPGR